ncbi:MAG: hypothetical protein R3F20_02655 [Planctomycetota bacterium]
MTAPFFSLSEEGVALDAIRARSRQRDVVEAPAEIGVAVLVEASPPGVRANLHVDARQAFLRSGASDADLPEVLIVCTDREFA